MVSEFYAPRFSETGDYLFIESRPIPKEIEKDTMELKEEKVSLDIWSWTDTIIQPAQNKNLNQTKENGQKAILHLNDMKLVALEENYFDNVSYSLKNVTDWLAISNNAKSYRSLSWNYPIAEDLSVININTGERKLIAQDIKGFGGVSTGGKYYYLYDKEKKQWLATEISSAKQIVLNQFKDPVWNVENDVPALPGSYGLAGWSEEDKSVFIYTQFSVWRVDLDQPENPVLLTPQDKDNPIRYRRHRLDDEELFIGTLLTLNAFKEKSKKEGFAVVNTDGNDFKMVHEFEDVHYTGSANAKRGPGKLLRKGTFVN
ncbi:MAG: hypothetical protein N4A46_04275, partial [Schleiferiaceae bacterium]|nr:hypothetical protein [Schleiferiaceae bacterium]